MPAVRLDVQGSTNDDASILERVRVAALTHPWRAIFLVALIVRLCTVLFVWQVLDASVYEDDSTYTRMAVEASDGRDAQWDDYTRWLFERTATMMLPLTALHSVTGPSPLAGQVFIAIVGAGVAVAGAFLMSRVAGRAGAVATGLVLALLPNQVIMSSVVLKDALVWFLLIAIAVVLTRRDGRGWDTWTPVLIATCLALLGYLRLHTLVTASWAVILVNVALARRCGWQRSLTVVIAAVTVPWVIGVGPAGITFVTSNAGSIDEIRASNARGNTAIRAATTTTSVVQPSSMTSASTSSTTATSSTTVLREDASDAHLSYLPHGVFALLFEPVPWRSGGSFSQRLAQAETIVWYPLLALAVVGLLFVRRAFHLLAFPLVVGAGTLVMWALIEGNIGTAYRHRGEFGWVICCLAVAGGCALAERRSERRMAP